MKKNLSLLCAVAAAIPLFAEIHIIDGKKYECTDTMCMLVGDATEEEIAAAAKAEADEADAGEEAHAATEEMPAAETASASAAADAAALVPPPSRMAQGYMDADEFLSFVEGSASAPGSIFAGKAWWLVALLALFGGLCMNLTPCVLPMIPVNLMIIGKSAARGTLYGLGIAVAYGTMGLLAAAGGLAFGAIQGNPWFNAAIAVLFGALALSMMGVFFVDFSKRRNDLASMRSKMLPGLFAFFMGIVSAVLAGACVAPVLIGVLLLTADLAAQGHAAAFALPFVLGLGMALPWPFAGAGLQVLPKPGAWMEKVNKIFGVFVLVLAAWYAHLAFNGFGLGTVSRTADPAPDATEGQAGDGTARTVGFASPSEFSLDGLERPVVVDCRASWCKNCMQMEKTVFTDPKVAEALSKGTFVRIDCEDISELRKYPVFNGIMGLPAFLVFE